MSSRQHENEQRQAEVEHNQDRYMAGVQTAISSVAGAMRPDQTIPPVVAAKEKVCKKCGAHNPNDSIFCSECGGAL